MERASSFNNRTNGASARPLVRPKPWSAEFPYSKKHEARKKAELVQQYSMFTDIPPEGCEEISAAGRKCEFLRGQKIYMAGDPIRGVMLVMSGAAKIVQTNQNGAAVILRFCGPGDLLGTFGLSSFACHSSEAQAAMPVRALVWENTAYECLSRRFPMLRLNAARLVHMHLRDMEDRFREISTERVAARLSRQIARLSCQIGNKTNSAVEIQVSREELAQLIGTTLFSVSRLLSEWNREGIVKARREKITILNLQALVDRSESVAQMPLKR